MLVSLETLSGLAVLALVAGAEARRRLADDAGEKLWVNGDEDRLQAWLEEQWETFDWVNPAYR